MIAEIAMKILTTTSAVTDLVGASGIHYAERPGIPTTYSLPAIVIQVVSDRPGHHFTGPSAERTGSVRITSLAATYIGANRLAELAEGALNGATGDYVLADGRTIQLDYLIAEPIEPVPSDVRAGEGSIRTHGFQQDYRHMAQLSE